MRCSPTGAAGSGRPAERRAGVPAPWWQSPPRWLVFALPAALALLVSLPAAQGPMLWDDVLLIPGDPFVHRLGNVPAAFLRSFWAAKPGGPEYFDYYRPLTTVTYIVNYALSGPWSGPYHLVNSAIYAGTAGLLALLAAELGLGAGVALAAGALFAAWPPHNENVDFISGRTDLLVGLFLLLALGAWARERRAARLSPGMLAGLAACSAGAAFSKELGYVGPAALLLYEWTAPRANVAGAGAARVAARLLAAGVPVAAAAGLRTLALEHRTISAYPPPMHMFATLMIETRTLLAPWPLFLNQRFVPTDFGRPPLAAVIAWTLFFVAGWLLLPRRGERAAWLATWLLLAPGCAIGVPASRMLYVPTLAFLPLAAWRLSRLPWPAPARAAACAAAVALGSAGFVLAGQVWSDDIGLYRHLVREAPQDAVVHGDLASLYDLRANRPDLADSTRERLRSLSVRHANLSLAIDPNLSYSWYRLGRHEAQLGHDSVAVALLVRGLKIREEPAARFVLAQSYTRLGRLAEAESCVFQSMRGPTGRGDPERWVELGWIQFRQRRFEESARASAGALALAPGHSVAAYNRALALGCAGHLDAARAAYREALARDPDGSQAAAALADIAEHGAGGGPRAGEVARVFLETAGLAGSAPGALSPGLVPRLREALARAKTTWPDLARLEATSNGAR
ncbi:MAG: hypothetical protein HZB25_07055 [Candidatus Eisenbacteria bacterium]|nr:hypothetical protein [Candidatus Eisenbacteria bacterium]